MRAALEIDLPVLGVCRGMQLMAVATGGSLHQHLPDLIGHERHRAAAGTDPLAADASAYGRHDVVVRPGSRAHALLGAHLTVNSFHHQAIDDPGTFTAVGWCPDDRVDRDHRGPGAVLRDGRAVAPGAHRRPADLRALAQAAAERAGLQRVSVAA